MLPFDNYRNGGHGLSDMIHGSNARHEYARKFIEATGQKCCAYCGSDLTETYESWLSLVLDHVIPKSMCIKLGIPGNWSWDYSNFVLACSACNGFCNRYKIPKDARRPTTEAEFFLLRDRVFEERKKLIAARHLEERAFYETTYGSVRTTTAPLP